MSGVDLSQIDGITGYSAQIIISEAGLDMSKFPSEKHFSSYLGLSPNNKISGGKVLSRKTRRVVNRATQVFRMAASSLKKVRVYLEAYYRRICSRLGPAKAITATDRKLACQVYRMLKYGQVYLDLGEDYYEQKYRERVLKNLKKRAKQFGYELKPTQALTEVVS